MAIRIASSSNAQLAYIPEVEVGETPQIGKGINLRMTGESLARTITKDSSKEINSSRQTKSLYLTDAQTSGGVNFELSAGEYDTLFEAVLMGSWSKFGNNGVLEASGLEVKKSDTGDDTTMLQLSFGSEVKVIPTIDSGSYFSVSADDMPDELRKPLRVVDFNLQAKDLAVITVAGRLPEYKSDSSSTVKLYHSQLFNQKTERSFSIERQLTDKNQTFVYSGMRANKLSLSFESRNAVTGSFDFIGNQENTGTGNMLGDKTKYIPSQSGNAINTVVGMGSALLDGVEIRKSLTAAIQKMSIDFDNNMAGHEGLGVLGNVDVSIGSINAEGTMSIYFNDASIYQDIITQKQHRFEFTVFDSNGHGYAFIFPRMELKDPKMNVNAKDEALMIELGFTGLESVDGKEQTLIIERF